ncbi:MAG: M48 family peptidase, partial [Microcystaceae cyanobacterium]
VNFMKKLQSKGGSPPEILSSHPDTQNRVIALQRKISPEWAEQGAGLDSKAYKDQLQSFR